MTFAFAQSDRPLNPNLVASKWAASWIASPTAPAKTPGVFYFRKELTLATVPAHYWVHVSADNRFVLHVNGKYAGEGPARGDLFHWRFETIDLAPLLHPGENLLAAVVWNFGESAPVAQMSNRTGFLMQGDTEAEAAVNTGTDWKVREEPGRASLGHNGVREYYAAGPAEKIDGRVLDWDWDQPGGDAAGWETPRVVGRAATREAQDADNNWELVEDLLPPMEHRLVSAGTVVRAEGVASPVSFPAAPLEIPANSHVTLLLDNRVLQTAYPELTVSGGRDAEIAMTYSEALYDAHGDKGNRNEIEGRHIEGITDKFIAGGGDARSFQPLWWRTWRYLQIDVTTKAEPLRLDALNAMVLGLSIRCAGGDQRRYTGAEQAVGDRLAHGAPVRARDLHGRSLLGAAAVRGRHAHPGARFLRDDGRQPAGAAGDQQHRSTRARRRGSRRAAIRQRCRSSSRRFRCCG